MKFRTLFTLATAVGLTTFSYANQADDNKQFDKGYEAVMDGSLQKAFEIWLPLAEKGHLDAMDKIGEMYLAGMGVAQDNQKGLEWLEKAAKGGNHFTRLMLGERYISGMDLPKDLDKAIYWYKLALEQGGEQTEDAHFGLGKAYMEQEKYELAVVHLAKVAEERIGESGYLLGQLYEQGKGVKQDLHKAFELYLGAETPEAYLRLGEMTAQGIGIERDPNKAKVYFQEVLNYTEPYIAENEDFRILHEQAKAGLAKIK
ncbi:tetratricopeptide repeat protein [Glaesserella sp.]|uniref:tetratricopeptide repeat protein n=1 Tax=Glaesserella sp. TaxID=2094731 RepID=UPI0035A00B01